MSVYLSQRALGLCVNEEGEGRRDTVRRGGLPYECLYRERKRVERGGRGGGGGGGGGRGGGGGGRERPSPGSGGCR